MGKDLPKELDFLDKLGREDRERFFNMTEEEKKKVITENKLAHAQGRIEEENAEMSQLADRIASKSFQG